MLGFLTIRSSAPIVGVALDNAIAAVRAEPDPRSGWSRWQVYSQAGLPCCGFEHYTEQPRAGCGRSAAGTDLKSVRTTVGQHAAA